MLRVVPGVPRILQCAVYAILCLAAPARAQTAEPGQVVGYAKADRSGPSHVWALPPDKPYLYIPSIPAALKGRVMAVDTGPEVGVALFKGPYFTSRDRGCQPALGTTRQPGLAWLGATARFAPAPAGQPDAPSGDTGPGFASLIVYRTDLGPPPGALFMARRVTLGLRCANPVHQTVYNRIFVPVAEAPEAARCFDLVGDYPGSNKTFQLDFVKSDRLVLMMPGDMSGRYDRIRHDYTVTLYAGLSCTGDSASLDSRARAGRDLRLAQMDFRDRARSLRLSYGHGNADAFLVRREAPPPAPEPAAPAPAPSRADRILTAKAMEDPAVGQPQPQPKAQPKAEASPAPVPELPQPPSPAITPATPPVQNAAAPKAAPKPEPPAPTSSAQAAKEAPAKSPPKRQAAAAKKPKPAVSAAPTARTIPKLSPKLTPPGAQTAALPSLPKTFSYPVQDLYRLNHCLNWQSDCGEPAATAWCRARGFAKALEWTIDENIGAIFPTVIFGNQEVCAQAGCDGFKKITCAP